MEGQTVEGKVKIDYPSKEIQCEEMNKHLKLPLGVRATELSQKASCHVS